VKEELKWGKKSLGEECTRKEEHPIKKFLEQNLRKCNFLSKSCPGRG
jgi:hypothetical protein